MTFVAVAAAGRDGGHERKGSDTGRGGDASLVVCEVAPEECGYVDLQASCDVAAESLVAGERVVSCSPATL